MVMKMISGRRNELNCQISSTTMPAKGQRHGFRQLTHGVRALLDFTPWFPPVARRQIQRLDHWQHSLLQLRRQQRMVRELYGERTFLITPVDP